jgi:hypothetical protein
LPSGRFVAAARSPNHPELNFPTPAFRHPLYVLARQLVFIDDATSRLMHLQFVQSESTFAYFNATQRYLEQHGKPVAFYTDKHAVFRVNKPVACTATA